MSGRVDEAIPGIDIDPDGKARIAGTRIEADRIAALLNAGISDRSILADYPSLTAGQVEAARRYADAHPSAGRSFPRQTAKAALRAAGLDGLEEFLSSGT